MRCRSIVLLFIMWIGSAGVVANAQEANAALDEAFSRLRVLEPGQDLQQFQPIEAAIAQCRGNEDRRADLEARFVAILNEDTTDLAKDYACRQLAMFGSDAVVSVLGDLLPNPRWSHMARDALEGIGSEGAATVLREMLPRTTGLPRVGIVTSLGNLADGDAVPAIAGLLDEQDQTLYQAGLVALGRIGNANAAQVLLESADRTPEELRQTFVDAMLSAGESLCRHGDESTAAGLFASLESAESEQVRAAAFRGQLLAQPATRLDRILEALRGDLPWKQAVAADYLLELERTEEISVIAHAMPGLSADVQAEVLHRLRSCSDPAVRDAALRALGQPDVDVKLAALDALVTSAVADDVPTLFQFAATADDESIRQAAYETLRRMTARGTNEALQRLLEDTSQHGPLLVQCALSRRSPELIPAFLRVAEAGDTATRQEAFQALEVMATEREVPDLVALLIDTQAGAEREAADRAVWRACMKISDPSARATPLLQAMEDSDSEVQCALLPTLARIGGAASLAAVHRAMESTDQAVRDAGYRALANWPDATVADELYQIAKSSDAPYRIWALRAFARVISLPSDRPPEETYTKLTDALDLATRNEDKQLVISRLAAVRVPEGLELLLSFVDQPELREAAVPAVFTLAKGLSQSHPDQARAALQRIQPLTEDPETLQQIPKVLRDIDSRATVPSP